MATDFQYIPHSCSERGKCPVCERRIAKERDRQRRIERMRSHFEKRNSHLLERLAK